MLLVCFFRNCVSAKLAAMSQIFHRPTPIQTMADGTVKQVNPFSGTEVWTVPGRGHRPIAQPPSDTTPLEPADHDSSCAFCQQRIKETPPEKARVLSDTETERLQSVVAAEVGQEFQVRELSPGYQVATHLPLAAQERTTPEFRRVSNLFEIVTYDYWAKNYDFSMHPDLEAWRQAYIARDEGRAHVLDIIRTKRKAAGLPDCLDEAQLLKEAHSFFGGGHDLIIGNRHYVPGAQNRSELASSGSLTPDEHAAFIAFTVESLHDLYQRNRYALYVAVFQNWLRPAGASFDHLHKQLVAIDERGVQAEMEIALLRQNPNMYNEWAVDYAARRNLIIAENDYAVCFAGFGHRFPTLEVFSKSPTAEPWLQTPDEIRGMSDLLHACHAAAGAHVPCNEEWHHKPADVDIAMPWRIMIKWRVSNLAGFEGGTKIYLNTLSPWDIRDKVVPQLYALRKEGRIADTIRIATECLVERNSLKYNPLLQK